MTVYLAAALFSMHERRANRALAKAMEAALTGVRVILPQDYKAHGGEVITRRSDRVVFWAFLFERTG